MSEHRNGSPRKLRNASSAAKRCKVSTDVSEKKAVCGDMIK